MAASSAIEHGDGATIAALCSRLWLLKPTWPDSGPYTTTGWHYFGEARHGERCRRCGGEVHLFRSPQRASVGQEFCFTAAVCRDCGNVGPVDDLIGSSQCEPESVRVPPERVEPLVEEVAEALDALDERERLVLVRRWQLDGQPSATLAELADELLVDPEDVRDLELNAAGELRAWVEHERAAALIAEVLSPYVTRWGRSAEAWLYGAQLVWPNCGLPVAAFLRDLVSDLSSADDAETEVPPQDESSSGAEVNQTKKAVQRIARIIDSAWWPSDVHIGPAVCPHPQRGTRGAEGAEEALRLRSTKMGRVIGCDSRREVDFFTLCDSSDDVDWFVEQPCRLDYRWGTQVRSYFPDALLHLADGRLLLVEVKLFAAAAESVNFAKWEAARSWCGRHGVGFVITDTWLGLSEFLSKPWRSDVRDIIADLLSDGSVAANAYRPIWTTQKVPILELVRIALHHGWAVDHLPFQIRDLGVGPVPEACLADRDWTMSAKQDR